MSESDDHAWWVAARAVQRSAAWIPSSRAAQLQDVWRELATVLPLLQQATNSGRPAPVSVVQPPTSLPKHIYSLLAWALRGQHHRSSNLDILGVVLTTFSLTSWPLSVANVPGGLCLSLAQQCIQAGLLPVLSSALAGAAADVEGLDPDQLAAAADAAAAADSDAAARGQGSGNTKGVLVSLVMSASLFTLASDIIGMWPGPGGVLKSKDSHCLAAPAAQLAVALLRSCGGCLAAAAAGGPVYFAPPTGADRVGVQMPPIHWGAVAARIVTSAHHQLQQLADMYTRGGEQQLVTPYTQALLQSPHFLHLALLVLDVLHQAAEQQQQQWQQQHQEAVADSTSSSSSASSSSTSCSSEQQQQQQQQLVFQYRSELWGSFSLPQELSPALQSGLGPDSQAVERLFIPMPVLNELFINLQQRANKCLQVQADLSAEAVAVLQLQRLLPFVLLQMVSPTYPSSSSSSKGGGNSSNGSSNSSSRGSGSVHALAAAAIQWHGADWQAMLSATIKTATNSAICWQRLLVCKQLSGACIPALDTMPVGELLQLAVPMMQQAAADVAAAGAVAEVDAAHRQAASSSSTTGASSRGSSSNSSSNTMYASAYALLTNLLQLLTALASSSSYDNSSYDDSTQPDQWRPQLQPVAAAFERCMRSLTVPGAAEAAAASRCGDQHRKFTEAFWNCFLEMTHCMSDGPLLGTAVAAAAATGPFGTGAAASCSAAACPGLQQLFSLLLSVSKQLQQEEPPNRAYSTQCRKAEAVDISAAAVVGSLAKTAHAQGATPEQLLAAAAPWLVLLCRSLLVRARWLEQVMGEGGAGGVDAVHRVYCYYYFVHGAVGNLAVVMDQYCSSCDDAGQDVAAQAAAPTVGPDGVAAGAAARAATGAAAPAGPRHDQQLLQQLEQQLLPAVNAAVAVSELAHTVIGAAKDQRKRVFAARVAQPRLQELEGNAAVQAALQAVRTSGILSPQHMLHALSRSFLGSSLPHQLQDFATELLRRLPVPCCCNHPACTNMAKASELQLVGGKGCICAGCCVARYCGKDCQTAHWKQHKALCRRLRPAAADAAAAAAAGSNGSGVGGSA